MRYLMTYPVAEFCPMDDDEIASLGIDDWLLQRRRLFRRRPRVADWARIADISVDAVQAGIGDADLRAWEAFGRSAGITDNDMYSFGSLFFDPLCVSPNQWTNGRHRGFLVRRAGASQVAVIVPESLRVE